MTEYNIFCYSEKFNDGNSFQKKRCRAFNQVVGEDRYKEIVKEVKEILGEPNMKLSDFWKQVTQDQLRKLLTIPEAKDFKEGFEYISGQKINIDVVEVTANGKTVLISKKSAKVLGLV